MANRRRVVRRLGRARRAEGDFERLTELATAFASNRADSGAESRCGAENSARFMRGQEFSSWLRKICVRYIANQPIFAPVFS